MLDDKSLFYIAHKLWYGQTVKTISGIQPYAGKRNKKNSYGN